MVKNNIILKCPHGADVFCCKCHYGDIVKSVNSESHIRDLVNDLKVRTGYKLIKGYCMLKHNGDYYDIKISKKLEIKK